MNFRPFVAMATLLLCCQSANACLNDSELPDHEREFRSQYLTSPLLTSTTPAQHRDQLWMLSASGVALMAGAVGLTWYSRKQKQSS